MDKEARVKMTAEMERISKIPDLEERYLTFKNFIKGQEKIAGAAYRRLPEEAIEALLQATTYFVTKYKKFDI